MAQARFPIGEQDSSLLRARSAVDTLPPALTRVVSPGEFLIEFPAVDLAGGHEDHAAMLRLPVHRVTVPVSGALHRYRVDIVDAAGRVLPGNRLHHLILFDPDHRELFQPILMRVLAAGSETGTVSVPWLLFGYPLRQGQQLILSGMITNPDPIPARGVRLRLVVGYTPAARPWPLRSVYPWTMDVAWPLGGVGGSKAFDLPPGRSEHSWEGSPAIAGQIVAVGGHVHDRAVQLELRDLTAGVLLWASKPLTDSTGHLVALERGWFLRWNRFGTRIVPDHRYRIAVVYDNPGSQAIEEGGMGSLSGIFIPDQAWPRVDPADTLFRRDLGNVLRNMEGEASHRTGMH